MPVPSPRQAATVMVLRDSLQEKNTTEVFMVRRHGKSGFMAGAHVFPGGVVDDEDYGLVSRCVGRTPSQCASILDESDEKLALAAHVAAVRETFEESALLLCVGAVPAHHEAEQIRLNAGEISFGALLEQWTLSMDLSLLQPLSRWVTPEAESRRYDTHFFLARAPEGQRGQHDQKETTAGEWLAPKRALEQAQAGQIVLPPPTLHTLLQLEQASSVEDAFASAALRPPPRVDPILSRQKGALTLVMPGNARHPNPLQQLAGPTRFVLDGQRWIAHAQ